MKMYYLEKSRFAKVCLSLFILGFGGLFLFSGHGVFLFGGIIATAGLFAVYCVGNMKVVVNDNSLQIIRECSFVLPRILKEKKLTIAFSDIQRIKQLNTLYYAFHIIKLKNGKTVSILRENNLELDIFMAKLDTRLAADSKEYDEFKKDKDKQEDLYRILLILFLTLILPLALVTE